MSKAESAQTLAELIVAALRQPEYDTPDDLDDTLLEETPGDYTYTKASAASRPTYTVAELEVEQPASEIPPDYPTTPKGDADDDTIHININSAMYLVARRLQRLSQEAFEDRDMIALERAAFVIVCFVMYALLLGEETQGWHLSKLVNLSLQEAASGLNSVLTEPQSKDDCVTDLPRVLGDGLLRQSNAHTLGATALRRVVKSLKCGLARVTGTPTLSTTPSIVYYIHGIDTEKDFDIKSLARNLVLSIVGDIRLLKNERRMLGLH
jgi:hypothetical protein